MKKDARDFYLPSAKNQIQSALFQLQNGNQGLAIEFLENAKRSIDRATQTTQAPKERKTRC
jgi:hypothetical protein